MRHVKLFILLVAAGGFGGAVGSMVGAAFNSNTSLFIGGFAGGLITSPLAALFAARRGWIDRARTRATAIGAAIGFLAAAIIAVNSLSTPIGALLSPLLVGVGGLIGARRAR
jgi:hypothetical protein